jgi:ATP-dependent RNA helicase DDX55/SPB4
MSNKDVCVEATTGSGKTLAFAIPIIEILNKLKNEESNRNKYNIGSLIIAPTRELAQQIYEVVSKILSYHNGLKCSLFVGGTSVQECIKDFNDNGANIVVGTPGRILDMLNRCPAFSMRKVEVLVLDEADMLLDMGFKDAINQILAGMPKQRRTGLFSATQTKEVKELARAGLRNPVTVTVKVQLNNKPNTNANNNNNKNNSKSTEDVTSDVKQQATPSTLANFYQVCPHDTRLSALASFLLANSNKKIIVFCSTCACVDYYSRVFDLMTKNNKLPDLMKQEGTFQEVIKKALEWYTANNNGTDLDTNHFLSSVHVLGLHGKMVPKKRNGLYQKFLSLSSGVLFTTDVAARGIDIPDVDWIVQLAAPKDPAFFVHRVGRTARAGKNPSFILFLKWVFLIQMCI